ncbi:membrane integrity-associated transporter subunit PqiC [Acetobacteraceae bacterium H6797]|nr:membrane integrity-associated transporter subunit PqiC [Acetobacteraceae bacterium H6797]
MAEPTDRGGRAAFPRRQVAAWLALAPLAACASTEPSYYRLQALPGQAITGAPRSVELRRVGLARYLDRSEVVRAGSGAQLEIGGDNRWAEPLGDMVTRLLAEALTQRLPGTAVFAEQGAISADPLAIAEVQITRFEADKAGNVSLTAQLAVRRAGTGRLPVTRAFDRRLPSGGAAMEAVAGTMSKALAMLADDLAAMLGALAA